MRGPSTGKGLDGGEVTRPRKQQAMIEVNGEARMVDVSFPGWIFAVILVSAILIW